MLELVDSLPWWGWLAAAFAASFAVLCNVAINAAMVETSGD